MVMSMPAHGVGVSHPSKKLGDLSICLWSDNKVPMVGHDAVGKNWKRNAFVSQFHDAFESSVIFLLLEQRQSRHGTIDHMEASSR
jgi:hypothetical protein